MLQWDRSPLLFDPSLGQGSCAGPAIPSLAPPIGVDLIKLMTPLAVGLVPIDVSHRTSMVIFGGCNNFHVVGVYAVPDLAQVVDLHTLGYGTNE